jgi:hypothetical protein
MTSEQLVARLGEPDLVERLLKPPPVEFYFGQRHSAEFLAVPEGTVIELWSYNYFRERWTYTFRLDDQTLIFVDKGYYHPSITY